MAATRHAERVLNEGPGPPEDGKERRWDTCPGCGGRRWEILVVPETFYCDDCKKATAGPNTEPPKPPEPEQVGLFDVASEAMTAEEEGPPIDEGEAWIAEEMPDE